MKIRIMGSPDLVEQWAAIYEGRFGVKGRTYPCRGSTDVRLYLDIDDRLMERVLAGLGDPTNVLPVSKMGGFE